MEPLKKFDRAVDLIVVSKKIVAGRQGCQFALGELALYKLVLLGFSVAMVLRHEDKHQNPPLTDPPPANFTCAITDDGTSEY